MSHHGCGFRGLDGLVHSYDCELCYCSYGALLSVCIPDSVRELCDRCFYKCESLRRVMFGPCSSLERIGVSCFAESGVEEMGIPDAVGGRLLAKNCEFGTIQLVAGVRPNPYTSLTIVQFGK